MSTAVSRRGGTTAQHATFTGADRELTVDTTKHTLVVHDGATPGGYPLAKESILSAVATSGAYADLSGKPTLGTAAASDIGDYATPAQGSKADTALQPSSLGVANGVASLDSSGKVPTTQLPDVGFNSFLLMGA